MKFENILKKGRWLRAIIETARKGPAYCPGYSMPNVLLRIFNIRNNTNIFRLPEGGCKKGYAKNFVKNFLWSNVTSLFSFIPENASLKKKES